MTNLFKELDLVDRVPEELWAEDCNIVQEVMIKTVPKKKGVKQSKMVFEKALQVAEERREVKDEGENCH